MRGGEVRPQHVGIVKIKKKSRKRSAKYRDTQTNRHTQGVFARAAVPCRAVRVPSLIQSFTHSLMHFFLPPFIHPPHSYLLRDAAGLQVLWMDGWINGVTSIFSYE